MFVDATLLMLELQHQKTGSPACAIGNAPGGEASEHVRQDQVHGRCSISLPNANPVLILAGPAPTPS
jgi:hypothetical protein